ncbi:MAG: hypothetical protein HY233_00795 [Acidobacteriales bacterium]|nr:hypothetical protein [Terriglobales bacterium]
MPMLGRLLARILEGMFIVGSIGSSVVFMLSGIEDLKTLLGMEEDEIHS